MATTDPTLLGRDTSCTDSIKTGRFVTGARLVAEAAYRRITTPRGSLRGGEDEANYGIDITELCGSTNAKDDAAALPGRIRSELEKDDRIDAGSIVVNVLVTSDGALSTFLVTISATTNGGPFELVVLASAVSVELLGLAA